MSLDPGAMSGLLFGRNLLLQRSTIDLPAIVLGQVVSELDPPRVLVDGQPPLHVIFQFVLESALAEKPHSATTNALGLMSFCSSVAPITAHSRTASCSTRQFSISVGDTKMPPTFSISSVRPQYQ